MFECLQKRKHNNAEEVCHGTFETKRRADQLEERWAVWQWSERDFAAVRASHRNKVSELLPQLLDGLSQGDFELAYNSAVCSAIAPSALAIAFDAEL